MKISDDSIWAEVQERAARHGWDDKARILREAHGWLCRRLKLRDDAAREDLRGRMDRLWCERAETWEAW